MTSPPFKDFPNSLPICSVVADDLEHIDQASAVETVRLAGER
jgi:hypothetical protein